jgi:hypothetical protein
MLSDQSLALSHIRVTEGRSILMFNPSCVKYSAGHHDGHIANPDGGPSLSPLPLLRRQLLAHFLNTSITD